MNMHKVELVEPTIPVAEADGLIKVSDLAGDIAVFLPVWTDATAKDTYQLTLSGVPVGAREELPDPVPDNGVTLSLVLPIESLSTDGLYSLGYRITAIPGGGYSDSAVKIIQIDRTAPGASLLAPALLLDISVGNPVKAKIPGYFGMEPGDLIQTLCNNTEGPSYQVQSDNLTTTPIEILFTQDFLESLQSDKVTLTYHVTDRAGNRSILAQPIELTIAR